MTVQIKLGSVLKLSGATARTFQVVPGAGDYRDDEIYKRGIEIERSLMRQELQNPSRKTAV